MDEICELIADKKRKGTTNEHKQGKFVATYYCEETSRTEAWLSPVSGKVLRLVRSRLRKRVPRWSLDDDHYFSRKDCSGESEIGVLGLRV
jgi:hypothetical protein